MPAELKIFEEFLRRRELKLTSQRRDILKIFLNCEKHLSVDDLYKEAKKKHSRIGHSTVFRTLKLIREAGLARQVDLGDKVLRFEHNWRHPHHDHLVCIKCRKAIEVYNRKIEHLQELLCKRYNFLPRYHRLEIFGICKSCSKKGVMEK